MPFKAILNQQPRCSKEELNKRQKPLQGKVLKAGLSPPRPAGDPYGQDGIPAAQRALQEIYLQGFLIKFLL